MTKVFDFSVTDIQEHTFAFAEMTAGEVAEKKSILEAYQQSKVRTEPAATPEGSAQAKPAEPPKVAPAKPVFRPKIKPPGPKPPNT